MDKVFEGTNDIILILDKVLQEVLPNNPENSFNRLQKANYLSSLSHISIYSGIDTYLLLANRPSYGTLEYISVSKENLKDIILDIATYYNYNYHELLKIGGFEEESEPIVTDKLPSKFYIKCNSEEESKACEKWAENRNLVLIHDFVFTSSWPYFLVDLNKKQYITNNDNFTYRLGASNEWNLTNSKELTLKDLDITIESNEENKAIEESIVEELSEEFGEEEPEEPKLFKKDDYIVIIFDNLSTRSFTNFFCYKQIEEHSYLRVYKDDNGVENGLSIISADSSHWRYATIKEVDMYDKLGKPFDVTTLNKLKETKKESEKDCFLKDDYIVIFKGTDNSTFLDGYCYKQRENGLYLRPYYDSKGNIDNGFASIYFSNKNIWRYATPLEIARYNRLGKPFDINEVNNGAVSVQTFKEFIVGSDDPINKTVEEVFKNPSDFISVTPINNSASCTVNKISAYNTSVNENNKSIYNVDLYGITPEPEI